MPKSEFRVLLVYPNPRKMSLVPGSIALFSSLLKREDVIVELFDTSLYRQDDFDDPDEFAEKYLYAKPAMESFKNKVELDNTDPIKAFQLKVESFNPDLLAVTSVESTFQYAITLLKSVRNKKILTILGGVFATFSPEFALGYDEVDIVCIGEGEKALVELVKRLKDDADYTKIDNLYIKKDGKIIKNKMGPKISLDELPVGDFKIFNEKRLYRAMAGKIYKMAPIETHRGCIQVCTFCNSPLQNELYKAETGEIYFGSKSVKNVFSEIKYFVDNFHVDYLFFWADNFFIYPLKMIEEFCEMYSEFKLPFYCQSYPTTLDKDKLKLLADIGLNRIGVGIEHGNEDFRRKIIRRNYSNQLAVKNSSLAKYYGIELSLNNIIGFPDETPELVMDTVELNKTINPNDASCSVFTPFRGTYLRKLAIDKGYLKDNNLLAPSQDVRSVLEMPQFTRDQIEGKRRTFNLYIKFPKNRWKEIALAEKLTPEGDDKWRELSKEYHVLS